MYLNLEQMVKREGPLGAETAADLISRIAGELEQLHRLRLIRGDLKPSAVVVNQEGKLHLLQISGVGTEDGMFLASPSTHEDVLATADYLAPEQALDGHSVDARADIYSLGCIFFYLLTGKPPFSTGTLPQRLMAHQTQSPSNIPNVPAEICEIYQRMLAKPPAHRYQSAAAVRTALTAWLERQR